MSLDFGPITTKSLEEAEAEYQEWWAQLPCSNCKQWEPHTLLRPWGICGIGVWLPVSKLSCKRQAVLKEGKGEELE